MPRLKHLFNYVAPLNIYTRVHELHFWFEYDLNIVTQSNLQIETNRI